MTSASTIRLVMSREIRQRLRSKGFAIFTAFLCLGIIAIGALDGVLSKDTTPTYDYAVVGQAPQGLDADLLDSAASTFGIRVVDKSGLTPQQANAAVRAGDLDVVLDAGTGTLVGESTPPDKLTAAFNIAWRAAKSREAATNAGLDQSQIDAVLSPPSLATMVLAPEDGSDTGLGQAVGTASAVLLFISINAFGGMVLTGVVEEKTTGVVEVLLSHVRAHQLLTGKVLGIGTVAMMQFAAALASGIIALRISGTSVPVEVWFGVPTALLWFVFGFIFYSTLFALAGSFVSRQEDAQGAAAPISIVFTAAYIAVFALGADPYSTAARIVSVLPPFSPLLMPLRISTGAASLVEIVVAAVFLIAATVGMLRLAGGVYARTLLHRGARLHWREALRPEQS